MGEYGTIAIWFFIGREVCVMLSRRKGLEFDYDDIFKEERLKEEKQRAMDEEKLKSLILSYKNDEDVLDYANCYNNTVMHENFDKMLKSAKKSSQSDYNFIFEYDEQGVCQRVYMAKKLLYSDCGIAPIKDEIKQKAVMTIVLETMVNSLNELAIENVCNLSINYNFENLYYYCPYNGNTSYYYLKDSPSYTEYGSGDSAHEVAVIRIKNNDYKPLKEL